MDNKPGRDLQKLLASFTLAFGVLAPADRADAAPLRGRRTNPVIRRMPATPFRANNGLRAGRFNGGRNRQGFNRNTARRNRGMGRGKAAGRTNGFLPQGAAGVLKNQPGGGKTPINAGVEVRSLKERHRGLANTLPGELQRLDRQVLPLVEKLPNGAQLGYLAALEQYPELSTTDRDRLKTAMESLAALPEATQTQFLTRATQAYSTADSDTARMKAIRSEPLAVVTNLAILAGTN